MKENFNYGLAYLRSMLCFMVVYLHFGGDSGEPLHFIGMCAVPCFVMMSFFLTAGKVLEGDFKAQAGRLRRFAYPMLVWGAVSLLLCLVLGNEVTAAAAGEQLLLGMPHQNFILAQHNFLNFPLWFEGSMIYTSLFFMAASHGSRKLLSAALPGWAVISALLIALFLQYADFVPWEEILSTCHYVPLTLFFTIPYGGLGLLLSRYRLLEYLEPCRSKAILVCALGATSLAAWQAEAPSYIFYYGGVRLLLESLLIFIIFYLLPFGSGGPLGRGLLLVSEYSMGIYCVHWLVGSRLLAWLPGLSTQLGDWELCGLIFVLSLGVAMAAGAIKSPYGRDLVR